jgi:hypothetical protein
MAPVESEASKFWKFLVRLTFETLKNLALLGALSVIFFAAEWLKRLGMEEAYIHYIELLHFWLTFGALIWIGVVFLVKLIRGALSDSP